MVDDSGRRKPRGRALSRRGFMKSAGLSAAAIGFPMIVPARALGLDGHTAPSERIAIGIVGCGKQMNGHVNTFLRYNETHVVSLCDVESLRLARFKDHVEKFYTEKHGETYKGCPTHADFRELSARPDVDAVVIATPDHWHALNALEAMRNGKDVYCEKPLSLTIEEGIFLRDAARRYGTVFQTGSQQRSSREFRMACELVRNEVIGKVHTVHVNVGEPPVECLLPGEPVPEGLDWNFWLGPAPWRPYNSDIAPGQDYEGWPNFRAYRDYSGGKMTDWGAHHFDIAQWGLGMDDSGPVAIHPPDGEEHTLLTYQYDNGVTMYHGGGAGGRAGVEFIGPHGRVMVNRGYIATDPEPLLQTAIGPNDVRLYDSSSHHQDWLDCIRTRQQPICDVEVGHRSATVCHLGNIAYWLKRPLKWDPVNEAFINDPEANRLTRRAMRSPWTLA